MSISKNIQGFNALKLHHIGLEYYVQIRRTMYGIINEFVTKKMIHIY